MAWLAGVPEDALVEQHRAFAAGAPLAHAEASAGPIAVAVPFQADRPVAHMAMELAQQPDLPASVEALESAVDWAEVAGKDSSLINFLRSMKWTGSAAVVMPGSHL